MSRRVLFRLSALVLLGAVGAAAAIAVTSRASATGISPAVRARMGLGDLSRQPAPAFSLVDQRGERVSLASLRGHVVVLDFMDPRCVDVCPLVSREFLQAARLLGTKRQRAVFLAVNVNEFHRRVADVAAFGRLHHLDRLAEWHFLTGTPQALRAVWHAYGVLVEPNRTGDVVHSSLLYFIDRDGRERWVASPTTDDPGAARWAEGIAAVVSSLS